MITQKEEALCQEENDLIAYFVKREEDLSSKTGNIRYLDRYKVLKEAYENLVLIDASAWEEEEKKNVTTR